MQTLIRPEIFGSHVTAFFTGKSPGADIEKISATASIDKQRIYLPIQRHTGRVIVLDSDRSLKIADAVITKERGVLIGVQVADCVPLLLHDRKRSIAGAVHAGWRGTAAGILKNTINAMQERFKSDLRDVFVSIGPSIKWCCYNVGYDVLEAVSRETGAGEYHVRKGDRICLDLAHANKLQAMSLGIPPGNIWMSDDCTYCNPDRFYSYRYAKGPTGRQAGFIGIL